MSGTGQGSAGGRLALSIIAICVSVGALAVSALAYITPIQQKGSAEGSAIHTLLDDVTQPSWKIVLEGVNQTAADSDASTYVHLLSDIWKAWQQPGDARVKAGHWKASGDGYEVCFPSINVLSSSCQHFSAFQFAQNTADITRFAIEKIPVGELVNRDSKSITTSDADQPKVYRQGILTDPSFQFKTVLLWTGMRDAETFPVGTTYALDSMQAEDERETLVADPITRFPSSIARYEGVTGLARLTTSASLLYSCWRVGQNEPACTFLNLNL